MGITEQELVKMLDAFMSGEGNHVKPQINEEGEVNFEVIKENMVFNGEPKEECPTCADIPNLTDVEDMY